MFRAYTERGERFYLANVYKAITFSMSQDEI